MTLRAELVENWRSNPWMRRMAGCLALMALWLTLVVVLHLGLPGDLASLVPDAAYVGCAVMTGKTRGKLRLARQAEAARLTREAKELRTPRVPDAAPDQCPVCAGYGLDALAKDDKLMERGADRAQVVAWGRRRAHWACAEFVPYVPTEEDRRIDEIKQWREEDEFYERQARQIQEETWPRLMSATKPGWREIRVFHEPTHKHYLLQSADLRHSEILTVESRRRAGDGFGWLVSLAERPVHAFPAETKLVPLEPKRLWNWTESRPYTRTELGMCDCGSTGPAAPLLVDKSFRSRDTVHPACRPTVTEAAWRAQFVGMHEEINAIRREMDRDRRMWPDLKGGSK